MALRVADLISAPRVSLSDLQAASFGGCPDKFRAVVWKLLLSYYPLVRDERAAHVTHLRAQYRDWVAEVAMDERMRSSALDDSCLADAQAVDEAVSTSVAGDASAEPQSPASRKPAESTPVRAESNIFGSPSVHGSFPCTEEKNADVAALLTEAGTVDGGSRRVAPVGGGSLFDDDGVPRKPAEAPAFTSSIAASVLNNSGITSEDEDSDSDEDHFGESPIGEVEVCQPPAPPTPKASDADSILRLEIFKDVERTHAELAFFADPVHTGALSRILLVYAKLNAGVGYIQGMNELLAPLLYVCVGDSVGLREGVGGADGAAAEAAENSLFAAEADSFFLFASLMSEHRDVFIQAQDNSSSGIRGQLDRFARILSRREPAVAARLSMLQIPPDFYAMRWLTALAAREFNFPDTLMLWDSLFADPERFAFLRQVCVAIIRMQRDVLLTADFATTVKLLQRPPAVDFVSILSTAMHVRAEENGERASAAAARHLPRGVALLGFGAGTSPVSRESSWAGTRTAAALQSREQSWAGPSSSVGSFAASYSKQPSSLSATSPGSSSVSPRQVTEPALPESGDWLSSAVSRGLSAAWGVLGRKSPVAPDN